MQVLVPIVVLRNHDEFNPWKDGGHYHIDLEQIKTQVQKMALPNQVPLPS